MIKSARPWLLVAPGALAPEQLASSSELALDSAEARHLAGPLRRRSGDPVILADGAGTLAEAVIVTLRKGRATVRVEAVQAQPPAPGGGVTLAMAVLQGQAMDWAVHKAVEAGARCLIPVLCERSQPSPRVARQRRSHWQRLALQAIKQCHRPWAMELGQVLALDELVERCPATPGLVASPDGKLIDELQPGAETVLLIGPEGGLAPAEKELLRSRGWRRLRLGPYTLRAETAAVVGTALLINQTDRADTAHRPDECQRE